MPLLLPPFPSLPQGEALGQAPLWLPCLEDGGDIHGENLFRNLHIPSRSWYNSVQGDFLALDCVAFTGMALQLLLLLLAARLWVPFPGFV